jgi:hypothetical protein
MSGQRVGCRICDELPIGDLAELDLLMGDASHWPETVWGIFTRPRGSIPASYQRFGALRVGRDWLTAHGYPEERFGQKVLRQHYRFDVVVIASDPIELLNRGLIAQGDGREARLDVDKIDPQAYLTYFDRGIRLGNRGLELLATRVEQMVARDEEVPLALLKAIADIGGKLATTQACADDWPRLFAEMEDTFDVARQRDRPRGVDASTPNFGIMGPVQRRADRGLQRRSASPGPRGRGEFEVQLAVGRPARRQDRDRRRDARRRGLYKRGVDNTDRCTGRTTSTGRWRSPRRRPDPAAVADRRRGQQGLPRRAVRHEGAGDRAAARSSAASPPARIPRATGSGRFSNGARTDFRSSEGGAYRLEGGQWWWITWDEWASQPDREIHTIKSDVLLGRARDHDAKIMPMAWPKPETEHHLIASSATSRRARPEQQGRLPRRDNARGRTRTRSRSSSRRRARPRSSGRSRAARRRRRRSSSSRDGRRQPRQQEPAAAGAPDRGGLRLLLELGPRPRQRRDGRLRRSGSRSSAASGSSAPVQGPDRQPDGLPGSDTRDLDDITMAISAQQALYHSHGAVDATGMGGLMAVRQLRDLQPAALEFKSRSNDRIHGNMRLAAITNALDCVSWGRPEDPELDLPRRSRGA